MPPAAVSLSCKGRWHGVPEGFSLTFLRPIFLVVHAAGSAVIERSSVLLYTAANSASPQTVPTVNIPQNVLAIPAVAAS